jgi:hypothetical protein
LLGRKPPGKSFPGPAQRGAPARVWRSGIRRAAGGTAGVAATAFPAFARTCMTRPRNDQAGVAPIPPPAARGTATASTGGNRQINAPRAPADQHHLQHRDPDAAIGIGATEARPAPTQPEVCIGRQPR